MNAGSTPAPVAVVSPAGTAAASPAQSPPLLDEPVQAFANWTQRYVKAPVDERPALEAEGIRLAEERRPVMKDLIREEPELALQRAVPMVMRQQLPASVLPYLEQRFNKRAAVTVYQGTPPVGAPALPPGKTLTHRIAQFKSTEQKEAAPSSPPLTGSDKARPVPVAKLKTGKFAAEGAYVLHVYGRRAQQMTNTPGAALNGIAIDRDIAVSDEPLRVLEVGELPDPEKTPVTVCPVSGKTTASVASAGEPVSEAQGDSVVETPEETVYLCGGYHRSIYASQLVYGEGSTGGPTTVTGLLPAAPTPALGQLKVLFIPLTFQDQNAIPATESKCYEVMRDVADYYLKSSYGKLTTLTTVTPPVKLPKNEAWYVQRDTSNGGDVDGLGLEMNHAREEARRIGFDYNNYDVTVVRLNGGARPTGGWGGTGNVWIYGDGVGVTAHEIGHSFGLAHANFWDTSGTSSIGPGANAEYGDSYDVMGGGGVPADHYNAAAKSQIKWMPDNFVQNVTASGLYRIHAFDQAVLDPRNRYALTIVKDSQRTYWGELRQNYTGNATRPWADQGMLLGWKFPNGSGSNIQLIDTTPGSPYGKDDAAVALGQTFDDTEAGIFITTVGVSTTTPKYVDVVVNMGSFTGNHAPVLALSASAEAVPTNATVTFTASATDSDGDALAYQWQHWGDTNARIVSPNSPVITRTFATAGSYVVSCTVSDMKGGTVTREKLVVVGNGNSRFTINGRVTADGAGLPGVLLNANGTNPVITDQDGYYTIANLAANTYSVTPLLYGYSFTELFNNNITVGPNFAGANFEASVLPSVSVAATQPLALENSAGTFGRYVLTRTGDISQPLTVNFSMSGTASSSDYLLSALGLATATPFNSVTIPADQATQDIVVTAPDDVSVEGPESLVLSLAAGTGYLVAPSQGAATIRIDDDDTLLPLVTAQATTVSTIEGSGVPAVVTLTRSGSTTAALTVQITTSGTATSGTDYAVLASPVTIPAGAASTTVNITSLNDALVESLETVAVVVAPSAPYVIGTGGYTATVSIVDDDTPTVTVTASDPAATEVDLTQVGAVADIGTFLITRTGDTSAPLTVYYSMAGSQSSGVPALNGADYEALPGVIQIPAGSASACVSIIPRWDSLGETPEQVVLQLGAGPTNYLLGASTSATVTINDGAGNKPYVEVDNTAVAVEPSTQGKFRFSVKGSVAGTIAVRFALTGSATLTSDYTVTVPATTPASTFDTATGTGTVVLASTGSVANVADLIIAPVNDSTLEDLESIVCTVTADAAYQTFGPTSAATAWLRDDDQPTVWVDAQINTSGNVVNRITENASTSPRKFYVSRTGSTTSSLAVNFNLQGTATAGTDYSIVTSGSLTFDNGTSTGVLTIPAGSQGADVAFNLNDDAVFEGTETIVFNLGSGAFARTPDATIYLDDNETSTQKVAFDATGGSGAENAGTVTIPVSLTSPASVVTSVDYVVDTGSRSSSSSTSSSITLPAATFPVWVRVVRAGNTFTNFYSTDGNTWIARGTPQTVSMSSSSYLVGIAVCSSSSGTSVSSVVDNLSVMGVDAGASAGGMVHADIGSVNPAGSSSQNSGSYSITAGGPDIATGTTDTFRYVYVPITNSLNCTLTARVSSISGGSTSSKAGVMIRETTATNARHASTLALKDGTIRQTYRTTAGTAGVTSTTTPVSSPWWVRLQRSGNAFSAYQSLDGSTWVQTGSTQTLALPGEVLAGLAVSARTDSLLSTAVFDNVSLTDSPVLVGRTVGYVNAQGSDSLSSGVYTVSGSGAAIGNSEDECHFVAAPVAGDFVLTARVLSQTAGAANAQAGVMVRENGGFRARSLYMGRVANAGVEFVYRSGTVTTAYGYGIDYTLNSGTLSFGIGDQTKNIVLLVNNDNIPEPDETITLLLRNSFGAQVGTNSVFTYTVEDNDAPPALPSVQFAAATSSVAENAGGGALQVTLSAASTSSVSVDYSVTGGSAAGSGTDYTLASGTLTFAPGELVKDIAVTLANDVSIEGSENIIVTLANPANANLGTLSAHTLTITDDDFPVVSIVANDPNAAEMGLDPGQFTVSRTGPFTASLTVVLTRSGTATSGTDYTAIATPLNLVIPAGQSSATINVTLTANDTSNEGSETVIETISANAAYTIGTPASATVTIADDDRSTVSIVASDPTASETPGNTGQFTVSRTAPTTGTLSVAFVATSGTATSGTDYTITASPLSFAAGETSKTITVTPVNDSITEGDETVVVSLSTGSYDINSGSSFGTLTIQDNDNPPVVYVTSPGANGPLIATGNGVVVSASVSDDGLPSPVAITWAQASGPGTATFATPNQASSTVTFSADGVYVLRITVTDTQFTVSDQVTVVVGSAIAPADWIAQDMSPSTQQRGQSSQIGSSYILTGMGAGYATVTTDAAHLMARQVGGDGSVVARLTALTGAAAAPLAGVTIRDSLARACNRAVLGYVPGAGLQFRTRTTVSTNDTVVTQAGITLPVWVRLVQTGSSITASYASDVSGSAGVWTSIGSATTVTMANGITQIGLTATGNSATAGQQCTATFDNVTLTPTPAGPAVVTEDFGVGTPTASTFSTGTGTYTLGGSGSMDGQGAFYGWQYYGDVMITAKETAASSGALNAHSGIMMRESMDSTAGYVQLGRCPTGSFNGYFWRSLASGSTGGVPSFTGAVRWVRLVRQGNRVTAFHAADSGGNPGTWTQLGQPQTVIMSTPVLVGFAVDNGGGTAGVLNVASFSNLSIVPLNKAPVVGIASVVSPVMSSVSLNGSVTDDSFPAPPAVTTLWSVLSSPGISFANALSPVTTAAIEGDGVHSLRLSADDGSVFSFKDVSFTGYVSQFSSWQSQNFPSSGSPEAAPEADPDHDGLPNLLEYTVNTNGNVTSSNPITYQTMTSGQNQYLQISLPKNPAATDVSIIVEATGDLSNPSSWSSAGIVILQNTSTLLEARDSVAITPGSQRFMRVRVVKL